MAHQTDAPSCIKLAVPVHAAAVERSACQVRLGLFCQPYDSNWYALIRLGCVCRKQLLSDVHAVLMGAFCWQPSMAS